MMRYLHRLPIVASVLFSAACIPYTVGSTARTVPAGQVVRTASFYVIPNELELRHDSVYRDIPHLGVDAEFRYGLDDQSDIGLRAIPGGIIATYKQQWLGSSDPKDGAVAGMLGAGFVNAGLHAHFEATLLGSTPTKHLTMGYGGLRIMQVAPLSAGAPHDLPTAGGFFGLRFGSRDIAILPELGVYYDHSALGLRRSDLLLVPAISVQLDRIFSIWAGIGGRQANY